MKRNKSMTEENEIPQSLKDAIGLPCTCDVAYKSRNLAAPDCPQCNYQGAIEDDVMKWCRLQIEKDREETIRLHLLTSSGILARKIREREINLD